MMSPMFLSLCARFSIRYSIRYDPSPSPFLASYVNPSLFLPSAKEREEWCKLREPVKEKTRDSKRCGTPIHRVLNDEVQHGQDSSRNHVFKCSADKSSASTITANSSPPMRATVSESRTTSNNRAAISCRTKSPAR